MSEITIEIDSMASLSTKKQDCQPLLALPAQSQTSSTRKSPEEFLYLYFAALIFQHTKSIHRANVRSKLVLFSQDERQHTTELKRRALMRVCS